MTRSIRQRLSTLSLSVLVLALPCLGAAPVRHTVTVDAHPIALWEKPAARGSARAVLLVHGRTWSARPDFDLQVDGENLSLMDALVEAGFTVYAIDLRGYGESPRDSSGWLTPQRAADDVVAVLQWIHQRQDNPGRPHLFGWSMGSTISQLAAQGHPEAMASLTLYGYWHDPDDRFAQEPAEQGAPARLTNTAEAAASDFITPGSISQRAIEAFVAAALSADPVKTDIRRVSDYNRLDPAEVTMPTLVIAGEFDPLAPQDHLAKLYTRLGTGHKQWVSVPGGDHAAHLEASREYFVRELVAFLRGVPD